MAGFATPAGMATPGGLASTFSTGLYTPGVIELRKDSHAAASAAHGEPSSTATGAPKTLYTVVPQVQAHTDGMMGSEYTYDLGTKRKLEEGGNDAAEQVQVEQEEAAAAAAAKKRKTDEQKAKKREFKF